MVNQHAEPTQPVNPATGRPKHPHGNNRGLQQAYNFRDLAADQALELKDFPCGELEEKLARAKALQALNVVWTNSVNVIRIYKGRPLPGSLRPEAKPKRSKVKHLPPPTDSPS